MAEPSGLRERKKAATREALQRTALTLYLRHGPEAVTVEDICAEAGVSPRTFFNYFATKDDAVFSSDAAVSPLRRRITEYPHEAEPLEVLRTALAERLDGLARSSESRERTLLLRDHTALRARLAQTRRDLEGAVTAALAARTGLPEDDIYLSTTAGAALAAHRAAIAAWRPGEPGTPDLLTLFHRSMDILDRGLRPE